MKTIVVMACRKSPDVERLRWTVHDVNAYGAVLSIDDKALVPTFGFPVVYRTHKEIERGKGSGVVEAYMNNIMAPLAKLAVTTHPDADAFLYLHDDIEPDGLLFGALIGHLNRYHFASGQPIMTQTPGTKPFIKGHTDRVVAWRAASFAKYLTREYPKDQPLGLDSMNYVMKWMDDEGDKYIWTDLKPTHVQL